MLDKIFYMIYGLAEWKMIFIALGGIIVWIASGVVLPKKLWKIANVALLALGFFAIAYVTVIGRHSSAKSVSLIPFSFVFGKSDEPELARTLLLNCLMFLPFGLGLAGVLPDKQTAKKIFFTVSLAGLVLSIIIEALQYMLSLGYTEVDDIIANTLGAVIAGFCFIIMKKIETKREEK